MDLEINPIKFSNLIKCEICEKESIYKCPQCNTRTCSLTCVNSHKVQHNCDGKNFSPKYIPLREFNDRNMLSDYHFLESVNRDIEANKRNFYLHTHDLPKRVQLMQRYARSQHIFFRVMSYGMTRHSENTTIFDMRTKTFLWHTKWIFPTLESCIHEKRVSETLSIQTTLQKVLDLAFSPNANIPIAKRIKTHNDQSKAINPNTDQYNVYMLNECRHTSHTIKYHYIPDLSVKLCNVLKKRVVIEYPIFYVIPKSDEILNLIYNPFVIPPTTPLTNMENSNSLSTLSQEDINYLHLTLPTEQIYLLCE